MHQPLDPLAIDLKPLLAQVDGHTTATVEGRFQILFVDETQQGQLLLRRPHRLIIQTRTAHSEELALAHQAQLGMIWLYQGFSAGRPSCAERLAKKSRSTVN